jgi:hypothetical protein
LNAVSLTLPPFLLVACSRQANKWHATTSPLKKEIRWSTAVCYVWGVQVVLARGPLRGVVVRFFHEATAFLARQVRHLHEKCRLATWHDPQTTHETKKRTSNPPPVTSNTTPCPVELVTGLFCGSERGPATPHSWVFAVLWCWWRW